MTGGKRLKQLSLQGIRPEGGAAGAEPEPVNRLTGDEGLTQSKPAFQRGDGFQGTLGAGPRGALEVYPEAVMMAMQSAPTFRVRAPVEAPDEGNAQPVSRWMSTTAPTAGPDTPLLEALHLMLSRWVSFLPVLDEQARPVGLLTHVELMQALARLELRGLERARVLDAMVVTFPRVGADDSITEIAGRMFRERSRCVMVVDDEGRYAGLLTEGDFLRSAVERRAL